MKRLGVLVLVLILLAAVYVVVYLGERREEGPSPLFPGYDGAAAASIYIVKRDGGGERGGEVGGRGRGEGVVLEKKEGVWLVMSEDSLPADSTAVASIVEKVASFSRNDMVSSNPEKRSLYEVDSLGVLVSIADEAGDTVAAFVVGKMGPDYQSTYIRDARSDDVILAAGYIKSMFDRGTRTWQDRVMFRLKSEEITAVGVERGSEKYTLSRLPDGRWYVNRPDSAACKQNVVSRMVRAVSFLRCDDFAGRLPLPESGLADTDTAMWFGMATGGEHWLYFGKENEASQVHTLKDDSDIVYLIARSKINHLLPALDQVLDTEAGPAGAGE